MDSMGSICSPSPRLRLKTKSNSNGAMSMAYAVDEKVELISSNRNSVKCDGNLFKAVMYGIINSVLVIPVFMSFATIIFRDPYFQDKMPILVKLVGASCIVHQVMFTLKSSLPFAIGQVQDAGLIFLSSMASSVVAQLRESNEQDTKIVIATTLYTLSISTALLGLALIVTGKLKIASLVQYLPMPVVGGYLAYIGFFCFESGLSLMANMQIKSFSDWMQVLSVDVMVHVMPGIVVGLFLYNITAFYRHFLVLPMSMICIPLVYYMYMVVSGTSFQEARMEGWISMPPESHPTLSDIYQYFDASKVQWNTMPSQTFTWLGMYFVVAFSSSLDVAAIEMNLGTQLNYNYELCTVGWSNLVSGLTGGFTGSYIFSQTIFTMRSMTNSRATGIVVIIAESIVFLAPISFTAFIPKFFFGGLLMFIGIDLMMEWMIHARSKLRAREYAVVCLTFILINVLGLEAGMCAGIICAALNFIYSYAEVAFVIQTPGRSSVQRNFSERRLLNASRKEIVSLELHGYLFFGSAIHVMEKVKEHIFIKRSVKPQNYGIEFGATLESLSQKKSSVPADAVETWFVLLDFEYVTGIDATAARSSLSGMKNLLASHKIELVFTRMSDDIERQMFSNEILSTLPDGNGIQAFSLMDDGIEWCEEKILSRKESRLSKAHTSSYNNLLFEPSPKVHMVDDNLESPHNILISILSSAMDKNELLADSKMNVLDASLLDYFEIQQVAAGTVLYALGEPSKHLYMVGNGQLELFTGKKDQKLDAARLVRISSGSTVGEIDFFLGQPMTFTCRTLSDCLLFRLSRDSFIKMKLDSPRMCATVQTSIIKCMSLSILNHLLVQY